VSDRDTCFIGVLKKHIGFTVISMDSKVNKNWCYKRHIGFIYTNDKDKKIDNLNAHCEQNDIKEYIYIGDSLTDYDCLANSKLGFIPANASQFLKIKIKKAYPGRLTKFTNNMTENPIIQLDSHGGHGCLEEMTYMLCKMGVLDMEKILDEF
jgi:3-deoxy-D-manno-octulosonate 8-phosphate phosphatase KdsC-like HAD superfamily phosphatase